MSESDATNVDVPAVLAVVTQLTGLSTSLNSLAGQMQDGSGLTWTGADKNGIALYDSLSPAEQGSVSAVTTSAEALDGLIDSLGTTAGLWKNTENTNIELNG